MLQNIKNIAILGAAESGIGAAILAKAKGYNALLSDNGPIKETYKHDLESYQLEWEENGHDEERILSCDLIIKSPGVPHKVSIIKKAIEKNIPIISEIEFGAWFTDAKIIAITGTNGKTTTTSLTYHVLKEAGLNVGLGGNIGKSFARMVAEENHDYYVLELSSFQLDDLIDYKNYIGILLNITPDHLNRYDYKFENYTEAKFKITHKQTEEDYFIYNYDDKVIREYLHEHKPASTLLPFSQVEEVFPGAYIKDNLLTIGIKSKNEFTMNMEELSLKGKHNRYNTMASAIAARILEVRKDVTREALRSFQSIDHRLETVAIIRDVQYVNDSKATNVNSVWFALESFNQPIIWIAGGEDKGNDYSEIKSLVKERVKAIICLGVDNAKLHEEFATEVPTMSDASSMQEAIKKAASLAQPGDVVLLSPACASFDLFENYEDRGRQFKQNVLALA